MTSDKEFWEKMIGILLLFFATYAITKDLIANPESTTKAFFYAVVLDFVLVLFFALWRKHGIKSNLDKLFSGNPLGKLILWNNEQKGYDLDDLIQMVETSNRQKRVVRIVERGVTRVTEPNVSLVLKSAELILLMSAIVNILNGKGSSKWRGMSPVSMENIALFVPA